MSVWHKVIHLGGGVQVLPLPTYLHPHRRRGGFTAELSDRLPETESRARQDTNQPLAFAGHISVGSSTCCSPRVHNQFQKSKSSQFMLRGSPLNSVSMASSSECNCLLCPARRLRRQRRPRPEIQTFLRLTCRLMGNDCNYHYVPSVYTPG